MLCLDSRGVGLSLICYWSISVAPVRGGTYFSLHAAKRSKQEKAAQTTPAKRVPWSAAGSGASGIRVLAHSALVTKDSSAPTPHYVRRGRVCMGNHRLRLRAAGAVGFASARRLCTLRGTPPQMIWLCDNESRPAGEA